MVCVGDKAEFALAFELHDSAQTTPRSDSAKLHLSYDGAVHAPASNSVTVAPTVIKKNIITFQRLFYTGHFICIGRRTRFIAHVG